MAIKMEHTVFGPVPAGGLMNCCPSFLVSEISTTKLYFHWFPRVMNVIYKSLVKWSVLRVFVVTVR